MLLQALPKNTIDLITETSHRPSGHHQASHHPSGQGVSQVSDQRSATAPADTTRRAITRLGRVSARSLITEISHCPSGHHQASHHPSGQGVSQVSDQRSATAPADTTRGAITRLGRVSARSLITETSHCPSGNHRASHHPSGQGHHPSARSLITQTSHRPSGHQRASHHLSGQGVSQVSDQRSATAPADTTRRAITRLGRVSARSLITEISHCPSGHHQASHHPSGQGVSQVSDHGDQPLPQRTPPGEPSPVWAGCQPGL